MNNHYNIPLAPHMISPLTKTTKYRTYPLKSNSDICYYSGYMPATIIICLNVISMIIPVSLQQGVK